MAIETIKGITMLSSGNSLYRVKAVGMLAGPLSRGCNLSRIALEYALQHDGNYKVKNKILSLFEKLGIKPRENFWEKHFCF